MRRAPFHLLVGLACPQTVSADSMLWMQWQGLGPDAREISLAPGQSAVIEIYFRRDPESFDLERIEFANEPALALQQIDTSSLRSGWDDFSVNDWLGSGIQGVKFQETYCDLAPCLPPDFDLYGTQTIRLEDFGGGQPVEVAFDFASIEVVAGNGFVYGPWASSNPFLEDPNWFHIGAGSPGYGDELGFYDKRDPLIILPIPEPSGVLALGLLVTAAILRRRRHG